MSVALDSYATRHLGAGREAIQQMLAVVGYPSLQALVEAALPHQLRLRRPLELPAARTETEALAELRRIASANQLRPTFIGQGYYGCFTPPVIQRNILENPSWYTPYTPYQSEISQGRLEALLNFQQMVMDLTDLDIANASLLDEATAAAEAMMLCRRVHPDPRARTFLVSDTCHPQTIAVVQTRAEPLGIEVVVDDHRRFALSDAVFGLLVQYPATDGIIYDYSALCTEAHRHNALVVCAADLLALTLLKPPGQFGADVAVGSTQRFGMPPGYGGPHAAYFATRNAYIRQMPGRLVGVSRDAQGRPALRLALQTREQHIRRDKATSNICTAQVLPAIVAAMYAVWHGPQGLKRIAERIHTLTCRLAAAIGEPQAGMFFDTLRFRTTPPPAGMNVRKYPDGSWGVSLDETTTEADVERIAGRPAPPVVPSGFGPLTRTTPFLTHAVFHRYHTEHEMLRYLRRLEARDYSLCHGMIPLGSCTMKLTATAAMQPLSWPELTQLHPFVPSEQAAGYHQLIEQLQRWLAEITGFAAVCFQPNAGSQGEYAGLLTIRAYHRHRGQPQRTICLIPVSAHGTNPASAAMAGMTVVPVACDAQGNIDLADLRAKAAAHASTLAAMMLTYPSTHGVFEPNIVEVCRTVHEHGGQVYLDGANLNAMVGLCRLAELGADVCQLNLHKTFGMPHGGGGPGAGPIGVAEHLVRFIPPHISATPYGNACLLPISWMYIAMMGAEGLTAASQLAILNANYVARRLDAYFPVLYKGAAGLVAHECILDLRSARQRAGIEVEDVAKRLMDYGLHAPTMSWPVPGTLMVEPTESESKAELDRFCEALIAIHGEIEAIASGRLHRQNNPLKHAPHTALVCAADPWDRPYPRELGAYPAPWTREQKFWPAVGRVDNAYGDRNLFCGCPPVG